MSSNGTPIPGYSLGQTLRLSFVPRWVIVPMMRQQTVAEHSWRVAIIAGGMAALLHWPQEQTDRCVSVAMMHDIDECQTGDVPATAKGHDVDYAAWSDVDLLVKAADLLESYWWVAAWAHPSVGGVSNSVLGAFKPVQAEMGNRWGHNVVGSMLIDLGKSRDEAF